MKIVQFSELRPLLTERVVVCQRARNHPCLVFGQVDASVVCLPPVSSSIVDILAYIHAYSLLYDMDDELLAEAVRKKDELIYHPQRCIKCVRGPSKNTAENAQRPKAVPVSVNGNHHVSF